MGASGTVTLNFGGFPGAADAEVDVTGQSGIASGSVVEAWLLPAVTADHTVDEHVVETIKVVAKDIVAGVGFTIFGFATDAHEQHTAEATTADNIYGAWNVGWAWV